MRQELPWQTTSWVLAYQRVAQALLAAITVMVENIIELERFLTASKRSARTAFDLEADEVLVPYPTIGEMPVPVTRGVSRSREPTRAAQLKIDTSRDRRRLPPCLRSMRHARISTADPGPAARDSHSSGPMG